MSIPPAKIPPGKTIRRVLVLHPRLPTPPTDQEIDVMARTLWGEARGEPYTGIVAVAWVILNRARADVGGDGKPDWWGEGILGVCCKPWQFSCWNENDPNRAKMLALKEGDWTFDRMRFVARQTAQLAFDGDTGERDAAGGERARRHVDPTDGAVAYLTSKLLATAPPKWALGRTPCCTIGAHAFFKEVF